MSPFGVCILFPYGSHLAPQPGAVVSLQTPPSAPVQSCTWPCKLQRPQKASEIIQSSSIYAPVLLFRDWHHHTSPGNHGIMSFLHDQLNRTHQKSTKTSLNLLKPVSPSLPGAVLCFRLPSACLTSSIVKSSVSSKFWFSQHSSPLTKLPSHFFTLVQNTLKVGLAHHQCFLPHFH